VADNRKARAVLGWQPRYGLREIVETAWPGTGATQTVSLKWEPWEVPFLRALALAGKAHFAYAIRHLSCLRRQPRD